MNEIKDYFLKTNPSDEDIVWEIYRILRVNGHLYSSEFTERILDLTIRENGTSLKRIYLIVFGYTKEKDIAAEIGVSAPVLSKIVKRLRKDKLNKEKFNLKSLADCVRLDDYNGVVSYDPAMKEALRRYKDFKKRCEEAN